MKREFYFEPVKQPAWVNILLFAVLLLGGLFMLLLLLMLIINGTKDPIKTLKDFTLVLVPLILVGKVVVSNRKLTQNLPTFIFDEQQVTFNHPSKGFKINWQDIQDTSISMMFNIPTLVIHTKNKKYKIEMTYFQNAENTDVYKVFKDYAVKYSGKKLIL